MSSYYRTESIIWDDEELYSADDLSRNVWFLLRTGPQRTLLPGLQRAGVASLAETLRRPVRAVKRAIRKFVARGAIEFDEERRVVRILKAQPCDQAESPNQIRAWWHRWNEIPRCPAKFKHVASLKALARLENPKHAEAWTATFAAVEAEAHCESEAWRLATLPPSGVVAACGTVRCASAWGTSTAPSRVRAESFCVREPLAAAPTEVSTLPVDEGSGSPSEGLHEASPAPARGFPAAPAQGDITLAGETKGTETANSPPVLDEPLPSPAPSPSERKLSFAGSIAEDTGCAATGFPEPSPDPRSTPSSSFAEIVAPAEPADALLRHMTGPDQEPEDSLANELGRSGDRALVAGRPSVRHMPRRPPQQPVEPPEMPRDLPLTDEARAFAEMIGVRDIDLEWIKYRGEQRKRGARSFDWDGGWQKWAAQAKGYQETDRARASASKPDLAPAQPRTWRPGGGVLPELDEGSPP